MIHFFSHADFAVFDDLAEREGFNLDASDGEFATDLAKAYGFGILDASDSEFATDLQKQMVAFLPLMIDIRTDFEVQFLCLYIPNVSCIWVYILLLGHTCTDTRSFFYIVRLFL